jgi:hypothetical protein
VAAQQRRLPEVVHPRALFTRAAPFGDASDPSRRAPSGRIGAHYSPGASAAAAALERGGAQARGGGGRGAVPAGAALWHGVRSSVVCLSPAPKARETKSARHTHRRAQDRTCAAGPKAPLGSGPGRAPGGGAHGCTAASGRAPGELEAHQAESLGQRRAGSPVPFGGTAPAKAATLRAGSPPPVGNPLRPAGGAPGAADLQRPPPGAARGAAAAGAAARRSPSPIAGGGGGGGRGGGSFQEVEVIDAVMRYHYYATHGVDGAHIAPYR